MEQFKVQLKDILVPQDRMRKTFTRIQELADSIKKFGLIHPLVVSPSDKDGKFNLVAGERRYQACILAGVRDVPCSLREDSELILKEIELEENVCRSDITFEEEGIGLAQILELKKKEDPKWGIEETARMTNRSTGDVSSKIRVAREFQKDPKMREACKGLPYTVALKKIEQIKETRKMERLSKQGSVIISTDLRMGNCLDLIKAIETASIDLLLTDPPYGVERIEKLRKGGSKSLGGYALMSETHNLTLEEVLRLLKALAPELHRVLKPGCHFYMFCGFQYVGDFIAALKPYLEFQPPLLIWDRGKSSAPAMGYNYMSRAEAIIYGCKPPRGRRLAENKYNILECPDVPRNLRRYQTEKPIPLLTTFIKQSTNMNEVVLDPFAGSASTLVAAKKVGRRGIGFEIDPSAFHRAQKRLSEPEGEETT